MTELVQYPLAEGGGTVLVAVEGAREEVVTRGWAQDRAEKVVGRAAETLEAALATIRPAADTLLRSFSELETTPKEIKAQFAVGLTADAGAYIAQVGTTANFMVTVTWSPPERT